MTLTPHTTSASRWILAKPLRSQSTPQKSRNDLRFRVRRSIMIFAFVLADRFMKTKMMKWDELLDNDLWNSFRTEFAEWIDEDFKLSTITCQKKFRAYLRSRDIWVMKYERKTIANSLHDVIQKETETSWTEEEILRCLASETFISHVINYLIETEFDRKSKDYSWQAQRRLASSQLELKHSESSHLIESCMQSTELRKFTESRQSGSSKSTESRISSISSIQESAIRGSSVQEKPLSRFPKFFQSPEFSSVFNRHLYSRLPPIPSYRKPPPIPPRSLPQSQLEKQPDEQLGEQPGEQSENQSTDRQSPPTTENSEHPDRPRDELPDELPNESLVEQSSFKPPLPENQRQLVKRPDESSTIPSLLAHPSAPLTSVSRPMGQPVGQSMRQRMKQLIRLAKFIRTSIHVRCDIEWIKRSLWNDTRQWLLNNRADETVLSPF
jgi:hypothetical protein